MGRRTVQQYQLRRWPTFKRVVKVDPDKIQLAHRQHVRQECKSQPFVLAVQDTTELDFTMRCSVERLGPIGNGRVRGLLQHTTLAVAPDGFVFGVLHQIFRTRVPAPEKETRKQRCQRPRESDFWHQSVEAVGAIGADTRLVHVVDRGSDDFSFMAACLDHGVGFLARCQHDRCVNGKTDKLWSYINRQPCRAGR